MDKKIKQFSVGLFTLMLSTMVFASSYTCEELLKQGSAPFLDKIFTTQASVQRERCQTLAEEIQRKIIVDQNYMFKELADQEFRKNAYFPISESNKNLDIFDESQVFKQLSINGSQPQNGLEVVEGYSVLNKNSK